MKLLLILFLTASATANRLFESSLIPRVSNSGTRRFLVSAIAASQNNANAQAAEAVEAGDSSSDGEVASACLGDPCQSNEECSNIGNAECLSGVCSCSSGNVAISDFSCAPEANNFGDSCVVSGQCQGLNPMAVCYKDKCICEPIFHVAISVGGGSTSSYSVHDSGSIGNSESPSSVTCALKRKLHESCQDSRQCQYEVWNSFCSGLTGTCKCNIGFAEVGTRQCVPLANSLHDSCSANTECTNLNGAVCQSGVCTCDPTRYVKVGVVSGRRKRVAGAVNNDGPSCQLIRHLFEPCVADNQCNAKTKNSECRLGTCQCSAGFIDRGSSTSECLPLINTVGNSSPDTCILSAQCTVANSVCDSNTDRCQCQSGFSVINGQCAQASGFNTACTTNDQCTLPNSVCSGGWCACKRNFVFNAAMGMCLSPQVSFSSTCFDCQAKAACAFSGNITLAREVCTISSSSATNVPVVFDVSSSVISVGSTTGVVSIQANQQVTASTTFTVTIRSSQNSSLTNTAKVTICPEACCTGSICLASSSTVVSLLDSNRNDAMAMPSGVSVGCAGFGMPNAAANSGALLDLSAVPFSNPCNSKATTGTFVSANVISGNCGVSGTNLQYIGPEIGTAAPTVQTAGTCTVAIVSTDVSGNTVTNTLTVTINSSGCNTV